MTRVPIVSKEYREEIVEEGTELEYRWWQYVFDFGDRRYRARLYTDEPTVAYVLMLSGGWRARIRWWRRRSYLRAIRDHLTVDTGRRIEVHILGGPHGYKQVDLD